jgi:hypothetical protein
LRNITTVDNLLTKNIALNSDWQKVRESTFKSTWTESYVYNNEKQQWIKNRIEVTQKASGSLPFQKSTFEINLASNKWTCTNFSTFTANKDTLTEHHFMRTESATQELYSRVSRFNTSNQCISSMLTELPTTQSPQITRMSYFFDNNHKITSAISSGADGLAEKELYTNDNDNKVIKIDKISDTTSSAEPDIFYTHTFRNTIATIVLRHQFKTKDSTIIYADTSGHPDSVIQYIDYDSLKLAKRYPAKVLIPTGINAYSKSIYSYRNDKLTEQIIYNWDISTKSWFKAQKTAFHDSAYNGGEIAIKPGHIKKTPGMMQITSDLNGIRFTTKETGLVKIQINDLLGKLITKTEMVINEPGTHTINNTFDIRHKAVILTIQQNHTKVHFLKPGL